jgi:ribosomal protein S18 acetylase RimI-like enzyme
MKLMSSKNYELIPLEWDTAYFGLSSAKVNLRGVVEMRGQEEIIEFCKNYDFVTIANNDNLKENNYWIGNMTNSFLTDVNIQLIKFLVDKPKNVLENTYVVNNLARNERILEIARGTFNHSRFFNDPKLPHQKAKNIYVHWTESAFSKDNKYFAIAEKEGNIIGYILFSIHEDTSVIELIAVDERYQGQRVGRTLVNRMESYVIDVGTRKIKVGTQVNNISAIQFYFAMRFKYMSTTSIYHLHRK